jgi:hypothetical protein
MSPGWLEVIAVPGGGKEPKERILGNSGRRPSVKLHIRLADSMQFIRINMRQFRRLEALLLDRSALPLMRPAKTTA